MKWIKHFANAHNNLKFQPIIEKYGWVGYAWYWILLELVAEQGADFRITGSKGWIYHSARLFELSDESLKEYLDLLAKNKLISRKALSNNTLYIPKMKEYADEYTKKVRSKSGVTPEQLPLEQNRTEQIRIDKKRKDIKFPKEWQTSVLNSYKKFKEISPQGKEWLPLQQECKTMFLSGRTPKEIIACMKFFSEDDFYKSVWTLKTVRLKLPEFVGKLASKEKQKEKHKVEQQEFDKIIELSDEQRAENIGKLDKMKSFLKEKLST